MTVQTKMKVFEFIAWPAHAWLWVCAWLVGADIEMIVEEADE